MRVHTIASTSLTLGATALDLASNFGGVPFASVVAALLGDLGRSCEQVKIHKSDCHRLIRRVQIVVDGLRDAGLTEAKHREAADELEMILEQINRRMNKWAGYNGIRAFWMRDEIAKGLKDANNDIGAYLDKFHIVAQDATHETLQEAETSRRRDQDETREVLDQILRKQDNIEKLLEMRSAGEPAAVEIMAAAQAEFHEQPKDSPRYIEYARNVSNLYKTTGVMPVLPDLSHEVVVTESLVAGGTYSDVSLGIWSGHIEVALKSLREVNVSLNAQKRFEHEIAIWHTLEHPHILRFLGIVNNLGPHMHIVSPWQPNGNALQYVKRSSKVDRLELLAGAARGVEYLHGRDRPVVHGNLKCANILVSDKGQAVISDFELSRVIEEITETAASVTLTQSSGNSRWCAPEIMSETSSPTLATDVYSFSMAILECLTCEKPFAHLKRDAKVVIDVVGQKRPLRPTGSKWDEWFTDELWRLMENCWSHNPSCRPQISEVATGLQDIGQEVARRHSMAQASS